MNCGGSSHCQILDWLKFDDDFLPLSLAWLLCSKDVLSSPKMMQRSPNRSSYLVKFMSEWKKEFGKDLFAFRTGKHVLDIDSWNHSDATMKDL
jgi:hypothetical protein